MNAGESTVIDLTEESPPGHTRSTATRTRTEPTGTHIRDWEDGREGERAGLAEGSSGRFGTRHASADPIVVGSDEEEEDDSFTMVGSSVPMRTTRSAAAARREPWHLHFLRPSVGSSTSTASNAGPPSLHIHDGIARGPHSHGSRISQGVGLLPSRGPLAGVRRAMGGGAGVSQRNDRAGAGTASSGGFSFGTTLGLELFGSFIQDLQHLRTLAGQAPAPERKVPHEYDAQWTHPFAEEEHFPHAIIEPPVDLETYFEDRTVVSGPLPDTTPICAACRHALVTGAGGDQRLWALPCGHVIDGRCVDRLSGITDRVTLKGKAKAVDPPSDEPPAKVTRTASRLRPTAGATTSAAAAAVAPKPSRFQCPVQGCGQKCTKESGSKFSAWEVFV